MNRHIKPPAPLIGFGHVWHTRLRPERHSFLYSTFFLMLPMRTLRRQPEAAGVLAMNRPGLLAFRDSDHGDGRSIQEGGALAWLEELMLSEGIEDAQGEIWLHCYPRVWGYSFKPVSFWYCHRTDGSLRAIVAEVNNTFGERHFYVLDHAAYRHEKFDPDGKFIRRYLPELARVPDQHIHFPADMKPLERQACGLRLGVD